MGEEHQGGTAQAGDSGKGVLESAINGLLQVTMSLPVWLRAVIVFLVLGGAGAIIYWKYVPVDPPSNQPQKSISVAYSQQYLAVRGQQDPAHPNPTDSQTKEASHKASEDMAAAQYHFVHTNDDDPATVALGSDADPNNSFHYRYFSKTDRCLYIDRTEAGQHYVQWVKDPMYHLHDIDRSSGQNASLTSRAGEILSSRSFFPARPFIPALLAMSFPATHLGGEAAQAGNCANPHPGQFRYWWGPPMDQCNSPMYRQFADGCTHYQVYNRCANAWDARINWVTCNPPPHH